MCSSDLAPDIIQTDGNGALKTGGEASDPSDPKAGIGRNDCLAKTAKMGNLMSGQKEDAAGAAPITGPGRIDIDPLGGRRCGDPSFIRGIKREIRL